MKQLSDSSTDVKWEQEIKYTQFNKSELFLPSVEISLYTNNLYLCSFRAST